MHEERNWTATADLAARLALMSEADLHALLEQARTMSPSFLRRLRAAVEALKPRPATDKETLP